MKQTKSLIDMDDNMVVTRGEEGWGRSKRVNGVKHMLIKRLKFG